MCDRKIVDYDIAHSKKSYEEVVRKVREFKRRGYEPFGSLETSVSLDGFSERFFQSVVKYEDNKDE